MAPYDALSNTSFEKLRGLDTCTVSNAMERLGVRLRNEEVPARVRTSFPPIAGHCYYHRLAWWEYVDSIPEPRVMVVEDVDGIPGMGAWVGEIHAAIGQAPHCVGYVTNGAVRDLPSAEAMGFQMFAGSVAVSHSYAHLTEFGEPVEIGRLKIRPGELVHGDMHGVHTIPLSIASEIPGMAAKLLDDERDLVRFCRSPRFSLEALADKLAMSGEGFARLWNEP